MSKSSDPLLLYFTSGTTALPKLVEHTHVSYPIGHLSTMYWMGLLPGDVHLNISSPGWAKHAWSNFFAPWLAGATILVYNYARFEAAELLSVLERTGVTTFCAPPTVWRMLIQADLSMARTSIRECLSAGEPLNPEVIEQVRSAWGVTIRDGYGQTETTAQVGNPPDQPIRLGSMGRPLPGYQVILIDPLSGQPAEREGELCLRLDPRPLPLMTGYQERAGVFDQDQNSEAFAGLVYHTGDVVHRDDDDYLTFVGRADDVFKASDYRISPFELESVLIEHPAVAEAAVVPAPDAIRLAVPKAYVVLAEGHRAGPRYGAVDPGPRPGEAGPLPADPPARVRRLTEDHQWQDQAGRVTPGGASSGSGSPSGARRTGVFRQRLRLDGSLMASITNSLRELAGAYLTEQCSVIIDAEPGLRQREPIIHPTRVGVRRLRSTLRTLRAAVRPRASRGPRA